MSQWFTVLPHSPSDEIGNPPWVALKPDDVRRRFARHLLYNLTRPEKSLLLLAPLAREAGGRQRCGEVVFRDRTDADYQMLLLSICDAQARLNEIKRFDMPGFQPRPEYVREMRRYGILPASDSVDAPVDPYATDRTYWESLWYRPRPCQRIDASGELRTSHLGLQGWEWAAVPSPKHFAIWLHPLEDLR